MNSDFLVIGSLNFDILIRQDRFPEIGETMHALEAVTSPGGKGANQAVQLGRLGEHVGFLGAVGQDVFAETLKSSLRQNNVDASLLLEKPGSSGLGLVNHLGNGQVTATIVKGANFLLQPSDVMTAASSLASARFILLQNEVPETVNEKAIEIASRHSVGIIMNAAPIRPVAASIIEKIDCLVLNEVEASFYLDCPVHNPEEAMKYGAKFADRYSLNLVITLGPQGSVCSTGKETYRIPPIDVPVVETTGAGDSFIGTLSARLIHGDSLLTACHYANCAASITIQAEGAQKAMPDRKQLDRMYQYAYA